MGSFILGLFIIGVTSLICWLTGSDPHGGWFVAYALGGWFCFAPIRKLLSE